MNFVCFHLHGPIWEEKFQTMSPLKMHNRFTTKKMMYTLRGVSTKVVQRIVKCKILDF